MKGEIKGIIERGDKKEFIKFNNMILLKGRAALVNSLLGNTSCISNVLIGDGGTDSSGKKKTVVPFQNALFGNVIINKKVVPHIDPEHPASVVFPVCIEKNEANGYVLNEMALQLDNGDLFSLATFPNLEKTNDMKLTWPWEISF